MDREPEWSDDDLALLIGLTELRAEEEFKAQAEEIGPHGRPMSEATSALADPNLRGKGWLYEVRVRVDHAQRELNRVRNERAKAYPDEDADSLIFSLIRRDKVTGEQLP